MRDVYEHSQRDQKSGFGHVGADFYADRNILQRPVRGKPWPLFDHSLIMTARSLHVPEHPVDVISQAIALGRGVPMAMAVVVATEGGAVRSAGSMMAISRTGHRLGYLSGGCIDADITRHALEAMDSGEWTHLRYGTGSQFIDLPLPCGGAIEIAVIPIPNATVLDDLHHKLTRRMPVALADLLGWLGIPKDYCATIPSAAIEPKIRLRVAGRGADALALARLAKECSFDLRLQLADPVEFDLAHSAGLQPDRLLSENSLPPVDDDPWTAVAIMLHDLEFEVALTRQALDGPAFYVGAVGSRRTRKRRDAALRESGMSPAALDLVASPIGLVPSLRDASAVAISALAQITAEAKSMAVARARKTALVLLAAGSGTRFWPGDKLLAPFGDASVLAHPLSLRNAYPFARTIAIGNPHNTQRHEMIEQYGWEWVANADAASGQASSLCAAIEHLQQDPHVAQVLVLLGDMPLIRRAHLRRLLDASQGSADLVFSEVQRVGLPIRMPPAIIKSSLFEKALHLTGDMGARALAKDAQSVGTVELEPAAALDIDCPADLPAMALD